MVVRGWEEENWKEESSYCGLPQESIKFFPLRTSFHTISFQIKALTSLNHISSLTPFKENLGGGGGGGGYELENWVRHSGNAWCLQLEKAVRANEVLAEKCMRGASLAQRDGEEPVTVLLVLESLFNTYLSSEQREVPIFLSEGVSGWGVNVQQRLTSLHTGDHSKWITVNNDCLASHARQDSFLFPSKASLFLAWLTFENTVYNSINNLQLTITMRV